MSALDDDSNASWGTVHEGELRRLLPRRGIARRQRTSMWRRVDADDADIVVDRRFCRDLGLSFGDLNPLYHDAEYAAASPWGRLVCPPGVLARTETVNGGSEGFPGCHTIWRSCELEWARPILQGDRINSESMLEDVRIVESEFSGGPAAIQDYRSRAFTVEGETVGHFLTSWHRFSRDKAQTARKHQDLSRPRWTDEELEAVWDEYRRQNLSIRRGAEPLYWDDVVIGSEIPYLIKGPTTLTSKLAFEIHGPGGWMVGHELALALWEQHPQLAIRNEENVPEPPVAIHWTNERCQTYLGMPAAYEAGYERLNWLTQLIMYWIGDHGFLRKMSVQFRGFHWQGDVVRLRATVRGKQSVDERHLAVLDLRTVTHRDEVTTLGSAVVELPRRIDGARANR